MGSYRQFTLENGDTMKQDANEILALERVVAEVDAGAAELADLQLLFIGGVAGEVVMV
jgi:hypothetical protein